MNKKLYKSSTDRVFFGVCGGIAEYFNVDPVLIRLIVVVFTILGGAGLIAYIIAAIIMPENSIDQSNRSHETSHVDEPFEQRRGTGRTSITFGIIMILLGLFVLVKVFVPWIRDEIVLAVILIILGGYFVSKKAK